MCSDLDPDPYLKRQGHTRSNNLYFLFSHSWPLVVYNCDQVQRTSQIEIKTNWGYSRPLDCLVNKEKNSHYASDTHDQNQMH